MISKTLGGERVGSGNKMTVRMHNYERSTHNLNQGWKSSMQVGVLYPFLCLPALRGDKFEIELQAGVRTVPSKGALFGSYKLQLDVYQCPNRLYTALLHNNPNDMGLKMNQVYFPQVQFSWNKNSNSKVNCKFKKSSLMHYLGLSGIGHAVGDGMKVERSVNAIPFLAYYDIFKNYYSNKQEENAYMFGTRVDEQTWQNIYSYDIDEITAPVTEGEITQVEDIQFATIDLSAEEETDYINVYIEGADSPAEVSYIVLLGDTSVLPTDRFLSDPDGTFIKNIQRASSEVNYGLTMQVKGGYVYKFQNMSNPSVLGGTDIIPFKLKNLDEMRMKLLSWHTFGAPYKINEYKGLPYSQLAIRRGLIEQPEMEGLVLKTYQSDIFNNWLSEETIKTVNEIAKVTSVDVMESGGLTIDALNFAEKMYNLLNRIAVSGNTYEDWQDVVYEQSPKPHIESPMYLGGLSQEIVFEEVISNAATEDTPLGSIGGRGIARYRKGGKISVKVNEQSFIIGIVSITPRINYSQGNEFYFTDIQTPDDFHKPGLDGIGFQDLIGERMAYFDTQLITSRATGLTKVERHSIGKVPAWLEYMTAVDKIHGDFAEGDLSYMVLDRDYEQDEETGLIKDATTYIDPSKYNYVFAYGDVDAQNFWVQIQSNIESRRKMSAKIIPNI